MPPAPSPLRLRKLGLISAWIILLALLTTNLVQAQNPNPETYTPISIKDFKKLDSESISNSPRYKVQGTVTYTHSRWFGFSLQSSHHGVFCQYDKGMPHPQVGQAVEVSGTALIGFRPYLGASEIRILSNAPPLAVRTATLESIWQNQNDGETVKVQAYVEDVSIESAQMVIQLVDQQRRVQIRSYEYPNKDLGELRRSWVEVTGTAGVSTSADLQVKGWNLWLNNMSNLTIKVSSTNAVKAAPLFTLQNLKSLPIQSLPTLVKVRGAVSMAIPKRCWIQAEDVGLEAQVVPWARYTEGEQVELAGFPQLLEGRRVLASAQFLEVLATNPPIRPLTLPHISSLQDSAYDDRLILIPEAEFNYRTSLPDCWLFSFEESGQSFEAMLRCDSHELRVSPKLVPGQKVMLTGMLTRKSNGFQEGSTPLLILRDENDLVPLSSAPWPIQRTLRVVTLLSLTLGAGLILLVAGYRKLQRAKLNLEDAEQSLISLNNNLERRIQLRTRELQSTNRKLNAEIEERKQAEQALADRESRLRDAQAIGRLGSFVWDAQSNAVSWSDELFNIYGRDKTSFQPSFQAYTQQIHPEDQARVMAVIQKTMEEQGHFAHDYRIVRPDGEVRWVLANGRVRCSPEGKVLALEGTCQDITDLKRAQARVATAEAYFRSAIENSNEGLLMCNRSGECTYASPGCELILGYAPSKLQSMVWTRLMASSHQSLYVAHREKIVARPGMTASIDVLLRHRSGKRIWVEISDTNRLDDPALKSVVSHLRDVTERKELEASLRDLSARVLRLQDEERSRLARDLHDGAGQNLAQISRQLSNLLDRNHENDPTTPAAIQESIQDCHQLACSTLQEIRTLSYLLHPPILDVVGLSGALKDYAHGFAKRSGIRICTEELENIGRLTPECECALLRVVQEALTNIHRHSGSQAATISLRRMNGAVMLEISDDGVGIPAEMMNGLNLSTGRLGVGLAGMKERMRQLGGNLIVESSNQGTRLCVVLHTDPQPLPHDSHEPVANSPRG